MPLSSTHCSTSMGNFQVKYKFFGKYYPETQETPAEFPELEIYSVDFASTEDELFWKQELELQVRPIDSYALITEIEDILRNDYL